MFEKGFEFDSVSLKEDLIVDADFTSARAARNHVADLMRDMHVDGRTEIASANDLSISYLKTGDVHLTTLGDDQTLSIDGHDATTLRVESSLQGSRITSLAIRAGHIHTSAIIGALNLEMFSTQLSDIDRLTLMGTQISRGMDLSFANINSFSWAMGDVGTFPDKSGNDLTGFTFKNIEVTRNGDPSKSNRGSPPLDRGQSSKLTKTSQNAKDEKSEITSTSLEMLNHSKYSASAYEALEKLLTNRGDSKADEVFVAGREAKRQSEVVWSRPLSYFAFLIDLFQEYVLGYGRMARYPMAWSALIIVFGCLVFKCNSKVQRMERSDEGKDSDSRYSRFWYSVELFVPVIDIGVAKKWHPKPNYRLLTNYARFHQIAGWILVPVILATLTCLTK